jgi:hypothetical protein
MSVLVSYVASSCGLEKQFLQNVNLEELLSNPQKSFSLNLMLINRQHLSWILDAKFMVDSIKSRNVKDKSPLPLKITFGESVVEAMEIQTRTMRP